MEIYLHLFRWKRTGLVCCNLIEPDKGLNTQNRVKFFIIKLQHLKAKINFVYLIFILKVLLLYFYFFIINYCQIFFILNYS